MGDRSGSEAASELDEDDDEDDEAISGDDRGVDLAASPAACNGVRMGFMPRGLNSSDVCDTFSLLGKANTGFQGLDRSRGGV